MFPIFPKELKLLVALKEKSEHQQSVYPIVCQSIEQMYIYFIELGHNFDQLVQLDEKSGDHQRHTDDILCGP